MIILLKVLTHFIEYKLCYAVFVDVFIIVISSKSPFVDLFTFIAQLVEHCTGIAEVTGSNPAEA